MDREQSTITPVKDAPPSELPGGRASLVQAEPPAQSTGEDTTPARPRRTPRTALLVAVAVCSLIGLAAWLHWRSANSARDTHEVQSAALIRMRQDMRRIVALRDTPQQATDRERPNEELLAQIEAAMKTAGVPASCWQDSIPQPVQRLPQSPYQRFSTRLYFEDVTLEQTLHFAHAILAADASLAVSALRLSAPARDETMVWNVDLAVSYLVYSPADRR